MCRKDNSPPKFCQWILRKLLPGHEEKYFTDGIEEIFRRTSEEKGKTTAILWYLKDILQTIPRLMTDNFTWSIIMYKNS